MDSDKGKLFVGGIPWDTTEDKLKDYFSKYGEVTQTVIMRDKTTGRPRGFGFVVYSDPSVLDLVLQDKHTIGDKVVEAKRALLREEQYAPARTGNPNAGRTSGGGNFRTKKIFVGGLPTTLTEDGFRMYFETFGHVTDVVIMYDQNTQRPRGFGFISFDDEDAVDRVLFKTFHELNGKLVEVKRALPKDSNLGGGGSSGGRGAGYQGYGGSGLNTGYDNRMDGKKFMQSQSTGGGFPPYDGYGTLGYGYGAANNGIGYGGYSSYGVGGYGSANAGYGGPAGAYRNPNAAYTGYPSGQPGTLKNSWSNQTPSGYGASGYGTGAPWSASHSGAAVSAAMGQSPSGSYAYGNQGYGYGNYGGSDSSYPGGYGAAAGRSGTGPKSYAVSGASGGEQQGLW